MKMDNYIARGFDADMLQIKAYLVQREQGIISQHFEEYILKIFTIFKNANILEGRDDAEKMEDMMNYIRNLERPAL